MSIAESFDAPKPRKARKARKKKADAPVIDMTEIEDGSADFDIEHQNPLAPMMSESGALHIPTEDGGITIDFNPPPQEILDTKHDDNLAEFIDVYSLQRIASDLMDGIAADDESRSEWLAKRSEGIDLLGLKVEKPRSGAGADAGEGGISVVRHPLLQEAVIRFQANARGELLPSSGPVKVRNDSGDESQAIDDLAEALERDLNHYLTVTAKEYYPDTDRMLFMVGFGGCGFKKVYNCPRRRRPVSESVDAKDLIVSNGATDLENASRVTHVISMRPSMLRRMQLLGVYRDIEVGSPMMGDGRNVVDDKIAAVSGVRFSARQEDQEYAIYECYCELDIPGFEHKDSKGVTGLPLPYRVTIEKDSQQILEIRRNWIDDPDNDMPPPRKVFVKYPFNPALGFYDIGLLQMLGNTTKAATAAWREMLDAGMYASFPGFVYAKSAGTRNVVNNFRVPPGGGVGIETGGLPIGQVVTPMPYKDPSQALMNLTESIVATGQRLGGTAETAVGEGRADAPVGTTIALIEQSTKIMSAVHKRLHAAQAEEFQLLKERFREDPEALWRNNKKAAKQWDAEKFIAALDMVDLVPVADPNTPSHMHRMAKAEAFRSLVTQASGLFDVPKCIVKYMREIGISDGEQYMITAPTGPQQPQIDPAKAMELDIKAKQIAGDLMNKSQDRQSREKIASLSIMTRDQPNQQAQVDPVKVADLQMKQQDHDVKRLELELRAKEVAADMLNKHADRQSKETIAGLQFARQAVVHPGSLPSVEGAVGSIRPLMQEAVDQSPTDDMMGGRMPDQPFMQPPRSSGMGIVPPWAVGPKPMMGGVMSMRGPAASPNGMMPPRQRPPFPVMQ